MSSVKVPCRVCGELFLEQTARSTGGLCMPCKKGSKTVPENFARVRERWRRAVLDVETFDFMRGSERRDRSAVWNQLRAVDIRKGISRRVWDGVEGFVRQAMQRVRKNVEVVVDSLTAAGYKFLLTESAHVPPNQELLSDLCELEENFGPLPLTLRLFYEEVGSVDLRQSQNQLVMWHRHERKDATALQTAGEEDPLVVFPPASLLNDARRQQRFLTRPFSSTPGSARVYCTLAPDEFHKANYSGGENYNLHLPEPAIDFPLVGAVAEKIDESLLDEEQYPTDRTGYPSEFFVTHLQNCFVGGGFRGKTDAEDGRRTAPTWDVTRDIAARMLPI